MKLYLLVFFSFFLQSVRGQVLLTSSLQPFSQESLQFADKSLTAVDKPYKVVYIPVWNYVMPPENLIDEKTTLTQLRNGEWGGDPDYLQQALAEQQAADLITARNYFDKLGDKTNTILVLDNIVQTIEVIDGNARKKYLEGRQFVFGDGIPASIRQVITNYSPVAQLDFNDQTLAVNDKYLEEYTSILVTTVNKNGAGSIAEDEYPKMIPLLIMIVDGIGYIHADPAAGLANLTDEEQEKLKTIIKERVNVVDIKFTPIDYRLKDKDFPIYGMEMVYAYKEKKTDDFILRPNKAANRTWKLNDKVMETIAATDRTFSFTAFIPEKDVASKYVLKDGENIFTISTDVGTDYDKKNPTTTLEIKFLYNSNKFFLKAGIKGKKPERVNFGEIIGDNDGHPTLKVGDKVDLYLYKQEGETEKVVSTAMWTTDNEKFVTADHYAVTIVDRKNTIMVKADQDGYLNIMDFAYQKPVVKDIEYSFVNINVDALPQDSKENAKTLFKNALKSIKEKNKALSAYFVSNNAKIQSYVLPGSDPLLVRPKTPENEGTVLMGFANKQLAATYRYGHLDVINISKTKKGIIQDATLVVRIYGADQQTLLDASLAPTAEGKAKAEFILTRLAKTDQNMSDKVRALIASRRLTAEALSDCYELVPDDKTVLSSYFGGMTTKKLIYLNYDGILASNMTPPATTDDKFTSVTAHEMMHVYFTSMNYYSVLKWSVIRDKQMQYGYGLGKSDCSMADGHEEYNPEDQKTCDEEKNYIPAPNPGSVQL
ncbi:hypothetical protein [Chitinophaga ginsengisoli]|uniref:Uncharacterized protein n=1 Tax=Chitinophaga ginsengisoli TaxID=363837 RepID=A0A2P8FCY0_9BACT|nr:hypothetical protein [Chitinophaga ginsengisoli]PSL19565.1 hypothetical protein CLV42_12730 [Chitinophaga ginsengisoli]